MTWSTGSRLTASGTCVVQERENARLHRLNAVYTMPQPADPQELKSVHVGRPTRKHQTAAHFFRILMAASFTGAAMTAGHKVGLMLTTPENFFGLTAFFARHQA